MPLFSIMVPDANKNGQIFGHALILNEQAETLKSVLKKFKEVSNPRLIVNELLTAARRLLDILPHTKIVFAKLMPRNMQ